MKKHYLFLLISLIWSIESFSQERQIVVSGTITGSETGMPIPGANVIQKGTSNGVVTDFDGQFSIEVSADAVLEISYLGFKTIEIVVGGRTQLEISLEQETSALDEVVVVGYGTQQRRKVTGAVAQVNGERINETPVQSIDNALAGRVAGLTVNQTNAEPGRDEARLFIRGIGTTGDNSPLIVIDGVANRGGFSRLDPNDIESVTVLKDASAAIYGAQAANGVILVTTKRGKEGKPVISYSYNRSFVSPTREIELADAALYARSVNTLASQQGQTNIYSEEQITAFENGTAPSTDWFNEVYKPHTNQERQNLSLRGGSEAVKYFVSLGTSFQDGLIRGDETSGYQQYNVRANLDAQITENLSFRIDLSGRNEDRSFLQYEDATIFSSTMRAAPDIPALVNGLPARGRERQNPLAIAQGPGYLDYESNIFNSLIDITYDIPVVPGLAVGGWMAVDVNDDFRKHFYQPYTFYEDTDGDGEVDPVQAGPDFNNTFLRQDDIRRRSVTYNANLNYIRSFGSHNVQGFLAYEQNKINSNDFYAQRNGYQSTQIDQLFAGSANSDLQSNSGSASVLTRQNYFGRLSYDYNSKYIAQFIFRYDGSSIFPEGNRFGFFPGIEAAWRISEERFLENNRIISELKIRGSYGELGNDRVDPFQYLNLFTLEGGYVFGGSNINLLTPGVAANPNITWETVKTYNFGLDAGFLRDRLTLSVDVFRQIRDDILGPRNVTVPNYTGLQLPDENIRKVENRGIELESLFRNNVGDFNYYLGGNFSFIKSEAVFLDEGDIYPEDYQRAEGHPIGSTLAYDYLGIYRDQQDLDTYPGLNGNARIGDPYYRDVNEDGVINNADRIRIDLNNVPQIQYGFQLGGDYKGLELNAHFAGQARANQYLRYSFSNGNNAIAYFLENAFDPEANHDGSLPAFNRGNTDLSTLWLRDVSFLRLKSLELAYNLPDSWNARIGMTNTRISVSGYNLITLDNLKEDGLTDPESVNIEGWQYPHTKNISIGFNATF